MHFFGVYQFFEKQGAFLFVELCYPLYLDIALVSESTIAVSLLLLKSHECGLCV